MYSDKLKEPVKKQILSSQPKMTPFQELISLLEEENIPFSVLNFNIPGIQNEILIKDRVNGYFCGIVKESCCFKDHVSLRKFVECGNDVLYVTPYQALKIIKKEIEHPRAFVELANKLCIAGIPFEEHPDRIIYRNYTQYPVIVAKIDNDAPQWPVKIFSCYESIKIDGQYTVDGAFHQFESVHLECLAEKCWLDFQTALKALSYLTLEETKKIYKPLYDFLGIDMDIQPKEKLVCLVCSNRLNLEQSKVEKVLKLDTEMEKIFCQRNPRCCLEVIKN